MQKFAGLSIVLLSISTPVFAAVLAPEIDASTGTAALALLSGGMLVLRSRRKK
jgi:hypothetical protein